MKSKQLNEEIEKETLKGFQKWCKSKYPHFMPKEWTLEDKEIIRLTIQQTTTEILKFIESERDNGNIEMEVNCKKGKKGFSAGLCLSKLIKKLEE